MRISQELNPFDKDEEPKAFAATAALLKGNPMTWAELYDAGDGLSLRTLGIMIKRLKKNGVVLNKERHQYEGGTMYTAVLKSSTPGASKKQPKTTKKRPATKREAVAERPTKVAPKKQIKVKRRAA